jgi:hypothetical protein
VQENVTVITAGTTPAITDTPPQKGQLACSAQVVPPLAAAGAAAN